MAVGKVVGLEREPRERVCGAIIKDNAILMVHHQHGPHDYWTLPGGAIETGESPEEAVEREVQEETSLRAKVSCFLFESEFHTKVAHTIEKCYLLEVTGDQEPERGHDPELRAEQQVIKGVAWFPIDEVRDDIQVSKVIDALKRLSEGRRPASHSWVQSAPHNKSLEPTH